MSDIVERLRSVPRPARVTMANTPMLQDEAADEIERLREILRNVVEHYIDAHDRGAIAELARAVLAGTASQPPAARTVNKPAPAGHRAGWGWGPP